MGKGTEDFLSLTIRLSLSLSSPSLSNALMLALFLSFGATPGWDLDWSLLLYSDIPPGDAQDTEYGARNQTGIDHVPGISGCISGCISG